MTEQKPGVKLRDRCLAYIDGHPRLGWYIALVATLNLLLNLVDAFDLF